MSLSRNYTGEYEATLAGGLRCTPRPGESIPTLCQQQCSELLSLTHDEETLTFYYRPLPGTSSSCDCSKERRSHAYSGPINNNMLTTARNFYEFNSDGRISSVFKGCEYRYVRLTPELPLANPPKSGLSSGAIAGISVAVVAVVASVVGVIFYARRRAASKMSSV
ncbi:hypothetical protein HDU67_002103 [Dinochytrium kinnereticum]|nr:hypothetical protein HDU67_002103 [Dinochytrium kinnereticum]